MIKFGRYELLERISLGGMAEVFKARVEGAAGFQKIVAVKRILPQLLDDLELEHMFINEAKLSANLNHSNIGQIYDFGELEGQYFIAMEYVQGCDLRAIQQYHRSRNRVMALPMALRISLDVCSALDYAHTRIDAGGRQHHIVHRDVSPPNILVSFDGAVKLIDFGIAKALNHSRQTATGFLKGKLGYLSPEQAEGREIDYRSDIFSLGIVLFEMITGVRLFDEETDMATLQKVRRAEVPPPSRVNGALPRSIDGVVLKALARRPEQRYQRAEAFYEALEGYAHAERQTLSNIHLSRWMLDAFGSREAMSTLVTAPPSGIARLEPEPALSSYEEETSSLPTFPHADPMPTEPRRERTPPRAPREEAADVPTSATRMSPESARLAAELMDDPHFETVPGTGKPPAEVVLHVPPAEPIDDRTVPSPGVDPVTEQGVAPQPPPEEPTRSTLKPLFEEMAEVAAALGRPAPAADDDGWDNLKTTPVGWRGQVTEPAVPGAEPEVVVTWQPPPEEPALRATEEDLNRTVQREPDLARLALSAIGSEPEIPTDPQRPAGRAPRAPARRPEEAVLPQRSINVGRDPVDPTSGTDKLRSVQASSDVDPLASTGPDPSAFEASGGPLRPSRTDLTRPERPAALSPSGQRRLGVPPFDSGSWKTEPTLTDEPEAKLAELTADLPPHAEAALAALESSPRLDDPPGVEEHEPAAPRQIGGLADVEVPAAPVALPAASTNDTEAMPAFPEYPDETSQPQPIAVDEPSLLPEPAAAPQTRPRRRWWLIWLALAMFVLGMGGTLLAILLRH